MRIAVLYSGNFRTFNECFDNHFEKIYQHFNNVDVYFSTWDHLSFNDRINDEWYLKSNRRLPVETKINTDLFQSIIANRINLAKVEIETFPNTHLEIKYPNYTALYYQYYKNLRAYQLLESSKIEYDIIIKIRPDIVVNTFNPEWINVALKNNKLLFNLMTWTNYKFDGTCINDMIWIGSLKLITLCSNLFLRFNDIIEKLHKEGQQVYGEKVCYHNIVENKLDSNLMFENFNYRGIR